MSFSKKQFICSVEFTQESSSQKLAKSLIFALKSTNKKGFVCKMEDLDACVKNNRKQRKLPDRGVPSTQRSPKSSRSEILNNKTSDDLLSPKEQLKQNNVKNIRINKKFVNVYFYLFTQVMFNDRSLIEYSVLISNIISDSGNAAFVLSDRRKQFKEKASFLINQPWFYGLILLILLIIAFINTLVIVLYSNTSNTIVIVVDRDKWGADPPKQGLTSFQLPIRRIILTHTEDEEESCDTQVW